MTVPSTTSTFGPLSGNGVTTSFGFSFRLDDYADVTAEEQIEVITTSSDGVDTIAALTTDYTVSLNGDQDVSPGGSVVFGTAPASGVTVRGRRLPDFTQQTALTNQGAYNAEDVETQFDQQAKQILALRELSERTIRAPVGETIDILVRASERALLYAAFDADGNMIGAAGSISDDIVVTPFWQTVLINADAAGSFTAMGVSAFIQTLFDDANAAAARTTLDAQQLDADLTAIAALGYTSGTYFLKKTAANTWALATLGAAAEALLDDATAAAQRTTLGAFGKVAVQQFTSSGTYTPNADMLYCVIECIGGGGAGGSCANSTAGNQGAAGGGGGGGYSRKVCTAADIGASKTVTIGAAGAAAAAGNNAGGNGGDTSVGSLCVGKGGTGGSGAASNAGSAGGAGGVAGTGDDTVVGQTGETSSAASIVTIGSAAGRGGNSGYGFGFGALSALGTTGVAGTGYGGGGSGGRSTNGGGAAAGGNGTAGYVRITEHCK